MRRSKLGHALNKCTSNYLNTPYHRSKYTPLYQKLIYPPHMLCDINHVLIGSSQIEKISKVYSIVSRATAILKPAGQAKIG